MDSIYITEDGSPTLVSGRFGETYHSRRGAVAESLHVFIKEGFDWALEGKACLRIGEIGLGSGLNALLTSSHAEAKRIQVVYHAIEAYPPEKEILQAMTFGDWNPNPDLHSKIMQTPEKEVLETNPYFRFSWTKGFWPVENPFENLDVLYYDAFAPNTQPELWNIDALKAAHDVLKVGGALVTYCAKGSFKRDLKSLGFEVQCPPGAPGKREMTRAVKR